MTRCPHTDKRARITRSMNRRLMVVRQQCARCGTGCGPAIPLCSFPLELQLELDYWKPARRPTRRRRDLEAFYRGPFWAAQSKRILERDGYMCRGENCGLPANQSHHLRYADPIEDTPDDWIVASCGRCNLNEKEQSIGAG